MDYRKRSSKPIIALILAIALCWTSCKSSRTLTTATERSEARTETAHTATHTVDSVHVTDSVYVLITAEKVTETRWRTQWRYRTVHDTVLKHTTDTVILTQTVEKLVEVPAKGGSAGWGAALALFVLIVVYMLIKSLFKPN